jgi:hypothetical protein
MIFQQLRKWVLLVAERAMKREVHELRKLDLMTVVAQLFEGQGLYDKAHPLYTQCLDRRRFILGENHPSTIGAMNNLAGLLSCQGNK